MGLPLHPDTKDTKMEFYKFEGDTKKDIEYRLLNPSEKRDYVYNMIIKHIVTEKDYHDSDFSISMLAEIIGCPMSAIRKVLADRFQMTFYPFIDKYRIEEAKSMLQDKSYLDLRIGDIALRVGFESRDVFETNFRNLVGTSAEKYRLQYCGRPPRKEKPRRRNIMNNI